MYTAAWYGHKWMQERGALWQHFEWIEVVRTQMVAFMASRTRQGASHLAQLCVHGFCTSATAIDFGWIAGMAPIGDATALMRN